MQPNSTLTRDERQRIAERACDLLGSNDRGLEKQAADILTSYTRVALREEGFSPKFMPKRTVTNSELERRVEDERSSVVIDLEAPSPGCVTVPFGTAPAHLTLMANRYRVAFARIQSRMYEKDVSLLRTWRMDIRQIVGDNTLKDMMTAEDAAWISAHNTATVGAGSTVFMSGTIQHRVISGDITRENLMEAHKTLESTPSSIRPAVLLVNNLTIWDVMKIDRLGVGGDLAEKMFVDGWTTTDLQGITWMVTIKRGLVGNKQIYYWGDPMYVGVNLVLEEPTMFVERKGPYISFYYYEDVGGAIANTNSVARVDFVP